MNETVGIIFGRFNPPHIGHKKAWEMTSQNTHWYIGTNESTIGKNDPLPYEVKIGLMKQIMPEIDSHIVTESTWLSLASAIYEKHGAVVLKIYSDEKWVNYKLNKYNGVEGPHGFYNFSSIEAISTPRLSSATALRNAILADDKQSFTDAAGVLNDSYFDMVAKHLLPLYNEETVCLK